MGKIHELSNLLANQIAAGEVIERPASVVKELVENAIDAGATQIDVIVEDAGQSLIRVVDNGDGIDPEDVPLAFTRHATSKISDRHDLFNILSLGFRGEALPSIAAIADVTLNTTTDNNPEGLMYHIKGGKQISATPANGRRGTVISVRDLFYNTPARLKYLKRPQTELSRLVDIMNRLALSYTNISFSLATEQKMLLKTIGNGNQKQVIASIYGREVAQKMLAFAGEDDDFNITGFISLPELTRGSREYLTVLINGRFIKNFVISNAVIHGFGSKLMVGRFPMGVININTNPLLIDVNVHPQKSEVRLSKEKELSDLIAKTIKERLSNENLIPDAYENLYGKQQKSEPVLDSQLIKAPWVETIEVEKGNKLEIVDENPTIIQIDDSTQLDSIEVKAFVDKYSHEIALPIFDTNQMQPNTLFEPEINYTTPTNPEYHQESLTVDESTVSGFPKLDYIGQMHGTFLFAQSENSLFIVDQHAAQERIKYEYYRKAIGNVGDQRQRLLVPITLNYTTVDMLKLNDEKKSLTDIGLDFENFGPTTIIFREHPAWFEKGQEESIITEIIDWILRDGSLTIAKFREKTAIMMSCKRSIKANMHLSESQARYLLDSLSKCENPYNCPHGRPVVTEFSLNEMEKMFKRIQDSHEKWETYDNHPF